MKGIAMREKIKIPKVNSFSTINIMKKWRIDLGDIFNTDDVIYELENQGKIYEIKAIESGMLVEKYIYENQIVEEKQTVAMYEKLD